MKRTDPRPRSGQGIAANVLLLVQVFSNPNKLISVYLIVTEL